MCLLIVASRIDAATPLVVGANRDERLDRPADSMTVLRARGPRILGGRDRLAGGTWLAVNEHGVVASLTNRPSPDGRDPSKRSRGELPLALASRSTANAAVDDFVERFSPDEFNPAWLMVGDRTSLYAIDFTAGARAAVTALSPGLHVLENLPFGSHSPKVELVRELVGPVAAGRTSAGALWSRLARALADHTLPSVAATPEAPARRPETLAACVHSEDYGTRCSTLVAVPADPVAATRLSVADGHPCTARFVDRTALWTED